MYRDDSLVYHNSYWDYVTDRPQWAFVADANYFKGNHEIKLGYTWRKTQVHSTSQLPGDNEIWTIHDGYPNMIAQIAPLNASDGESKYQSFYVGDTLTLNRATINAGVRYDYQSASVLPSASPAVPGWDLLPAVTAPGIDGVVTYKLLQPRVGMTYSLDESRKTQLRATYAMFTSQIGSGTAGFMSAVQYRYIYYPATDLNGNKLADPNEIDRSHLLGWGGFDLENPSGAGESIHRVGDYGVPKTHEVIAGMDRELFRNFGISGSFTWRKIVDVNYRPMVNALNPSTVITAADYVQVSSATGTLPSGIDGTQGGSYNVPIYGLKDAAMIPSSKGGEYRQRDGYSQRYWGFEVTATKRMADRWMARIGFSTNDWREYYDSISTKGPTNGSSDPTSVVATPNIDGGYVVSAAGGSGKSGIYMVQPKYQFVANGAYQAPYGIDIGVNYLIRQGYPMPWYQTIRNIPDPNQFSKNVLLVPDFGQDRLPAVSTLDMRIGKAFAFKTVRMNFDFDIFNLLNSPTVLVRQYNAAAAPGNTGYTNVLEIMQPRIARLGLRITF
jgi:hypothetical protein